MSISPDGRKLVFAASRKGGLWIRDFNTLEWRRLPGTEGATTPFWSPDGRHLAFVAERQLKKIDVAAGPPQMLCTAPDSAALGDRNRDGVIIFGSSGINAGGPLWKVSQAGGLGTAITDVDTTKGEAYDWAPAFLPDGKATSISARERRARRSLSLIAGRNARCSQRRRVQRGSRFLVSRGSLDPRCVERATQAFHFSAKRRLTGSLVSGRQTYRFRGGQWFGHDL